jgi:hypothetical protein
MPPGAIGYRKIPLSDPNAPVTADVLDRIQQRIQEMAASIPGPASPNVVTVRGDYQVTGVEDVLHVSAQLSPVKITLLTPSSSNRPITIKQVDVQAGKTKVNPVTVVTPDGSSTIAGKPSIALDDTGTGSVTLTSDDQQHWPTSGAGGNPPVPVPSPGSGGAVFVPYIGIAPIKVVGNVISFTGLPPVPPVTPWVAPVPLASPNPFASGTTGAEGWANECSVDFTGAPSTVTAYLWFEAMDSASNGIVRIRVGTGAYKTIADPVFVTVPVTSATMSSISVPTSVLAPIGQARVTLTLQSTNTNKLVATGINLLFR